MPSSLVSNINMRRRSIIAPMPHDEGPLRLTRAQVREIDRRSIEEYHIPGIVLMENAARAASEIALNVMNGSVVLPGLITSHAVILCGGGNNGGDGLAIARHLHNAGKDVRIFLTVDPAKYTGDALINWRIVEAMKLPVEPAKAAEIAGVSNALIIDAIFGTGLTQRPRDPFSALVAAVERAACPVLAIDVPSGLDCDTGKPFGPCIKADVTITFV